MADAVEIPLPGGQVALISAQDAELVARYRWHAHPKTHATYVRTIVRDADGRRVKLYLHRVIMEPPDGVEIDHVNHDGLDNRRENLRFATHGQNVINQRLLNGSATGYKGVTYDKARGLWRAKIQVGGRSRYLGRFTDPWDAACAYNAAAAAEWGEFAQLNERKTDGQVSEQSQRRDLIQRLRLAGVDLRQKHHLYATQTLQELVDVLDRAGIPQPPN